MPSNLYLPLKTARSTRLLTLLPDAPGSPLRAELSEVDLKSKLHYDAISYTWGDDTSTTSITINDAQVHIRHNLFDFLIQLRRHGQIDPLWVDAVSISQTDIVEKGQQVAIIGEIFRQARRVLIWVGQHADDSESLFQPWLCPPRTCPVIPSKFKDSRVNSKLWWVANKMVHITPEHQYHRFEVWLAFLRRPYWQRLWIIQEVVLAKGIIVHCGDMRASWEDVVGATMQPHMSEVFDGIELDRLVSQNLSATGAAAAPHTQRLSRSSADPTSDRVAELRKAMHHLAQLDCLRHQRSNKGVHFIVHNIHPANTAFKDSTTTLRREAFDVAHLNVLFPDVRCVDRRDHVYGLLALEREGEGKGLERLNEKGLNGSLRPDYAINAAELFVRVCKARLEAWRGGFAGVAMAMGYLSGLDPQGRSREFIEIMERVLLTKREVWEGALIVLQREMTAVSNNSEREDLKVISMGLRLSDRASEWKGNLKEMEVEEEDRKKMNKAYEDYKKRRRRTQA